MRVEINYDEKAFDREIQKAVRKMFEGLPRTRTLRIGRLRASFWWERKRPGT
jgi:hypothetical protein